MVVWYIKQSNREIIMITCFKICEVVKVTHKVPAQEGWNDVWVEEMNAAIGHVGIIRRIDMFGGITIEFLHDDINARCGMMYGYPSKSLKTMPLAVL